MRKQAIISITVLMVAVSAHALDRSARLTRQIFFRFTRASQTYVAERNGSVSNEEAIGHRITFAGISGCDINLKRIAGSNGVGLSQTWNATAVGNGCPPDPVYQFSLAQDQDGLTEFAMKRDFATKGSAVDSLMRTNWKWTPMTPGEYQVQVVLKATYGSPDRDRLEAVSHPVSIPVRSWKWRDRRTILWSLYTLQISTVAKCSRCDFASLAHPIRPRGSSRTRFLVRVI